MGTNACTPLGPDRCVSTCASCGVRRCVTRREAFLRSVLP